MLEENPQPSSVEVLMSLQDQVHSLRKHVYQLEETHKSLNELILQIAKRNHEERDVRLRDRLAVAALPGILGDRKVACHDVFEMERVANAAIGYADAVIERLRTK